MIPGSEVRWQTEDWQWQLSHAVRDVRELYELLELDSSDLPAALAASDEFALRVPRPYIARMEKGNPDDPLLRQVLPLGRELEHQPGFSADPLAEARSNPQPGLIHKYRGRVLLIVSGSCAVNCRYCFRRSFPYEQNRPSRAQWRQALDYIAADDSLDEVILSGGDPLSASDHSLQYLVEALAEIPHLRRLRVHTRLPVVIPQRITQRCLNWLTGSRLQPVMVIHGNHPREIGADVTAALQPLRAAGVTLLNQAVLLRGINDDAETLCQLSERLFAGGVLPYYLHLLDRVQGAAHFEVSEARARELSAAMSRRLPGYLVPKLAREEPGRPGKTVLSTPWREPLAGAR